MTFRQALQQACLSLGNHRMADGMMNRLTPESRIMLGGMTFPDDPAFVERLTNILVKNASSEEGSELGIESVNELSALLEEFVVKEVNQ